MTSECKEGHIYTQAESKCFDPSSPEPLPEDIVEEENTEFAQNAGYATKSVIAGGVALSSASLILAGGSSQGLFGAVNQLQLMLLFPLFRLFVPTIIVKFYESLDWTLFSFNFISLGQIPVVNEIWESFEEEQEDMYLNIIGIEQTSSLLNIFSCLFLLLLLMIFHLFLTLIY